jgi:hypothetical protein
MNNEYIAGLFDGDGCIMINYADKNAQNRKFYMNMQITNNYLPVLEQIQKLWGGNIYRQPRVKATHNDTFQWKVSSKRAYAFAKALYPFVIIKKKQVALGLEFQKHVIRWKRRRSMHKKGHKGFLGNLPLPEHEVQWRENIANEMSKLKNVELFELRQPLRKTRLIRQNAEMQMTS